MRFPDLLATRPGRMAAFFFLYMTEGIPLGFTATAIATQMRRQGLGPAEIGAFVASLYLPWAFKWATGPFVDVIASDRLGRRRGWILIMQLLMVATLLIAFPVDYVKNLQFFTVLIFIHNLFAATMDVAIDALAVNVLPEAERGAANGFMFGGAYIGQAVGGAGVLFLVPHLGFPPTFFVVAATILLVTVFVVLPLREPPGPPRPAVIGSKLVAIGTEIGQFAKDAFSAFIGSRGAFVGLLFALLPGGAYALGLALQSNLAVELGLNDTQVGFINLWSTVISAVFCVAGGWLSDRFGRRITLAWTMAATVLPTLYLAYVMHQQHWIMPVPLDAANRAVPSAVLVGTFWATVLIYNVFQGLYYGIRTALFMDVTTPRVAATQFTAYMALMNLAISFSAQWQGWAVERFGYPKTLAADCVIGLVCLACLPFMGAVKKRMDAGPGAAIPEAIAP
ncbi:MAG: MFS transporter [Candidatus Eisenbacteria bacterium]|uniref:MFS transporter n=1 Tax=Eiseniibacteriota bacterium TaxID=2212470 RepID=A0A849SI37_UNCEI|nr:MFS transporter [Candidatus Eisenbacteria bacterium]